VLKLCLFFFSSQSCSSDCRLL